MCWTLPRQPLLPMQLLLLLLLTHPSPRCVQAQWLSYSSHPHCCSDDSPAMLHVYCARHLGSRYICLGLVMSQGSCTRLMWLRCAGHLAFAHLIRFTRLHNRHHLFAEVQQPVTCRHAVSAVQKKKRRGVGWPKPRPGVVLSHAKGAAAHVSQGAAVGVRAVPQGVRFVGAFPRRTVQGPVGRTVGHTVMQACATSCIPALSYMLGHLRLSMTLLSVFCL